MMLIKVNIDDDGDDDDNGAEYDPNKTNYNWEFQD